MSSLSNTKASSGVLDPCHRLSSLAHASTCREQASEPAIIDSSTWDIDRTVSARAIWVEFRRAESNNAKLKTRNDSGATALETEQKVSNVIGKSRSETTPPANKAEGNELVGSIRGRSRTQEQEEGPRDWDQTLALIALSLLSLLLVVGVVVVDTTRTSSSSRRRRRRRKTKSLLERSSSLSSSLSHPLIQQHMRTRVSEWERELLISHELEGRKVCIVLYHVSLSLNERERERRYKTRKQTTNREYHMLVVDDLLLLLL